MKDFTIKLYSYDHKPVTENADSDSDQIVMNFIQKLKRMLWRIVKAAK